MGTVTPSFHSLGTTSPPSLGIWDADHADHADPVMVRASASGTGDQPDYEGRALINGADSWTRLGYEVDRVRPFE